MKWDEDWDLLWSASWWWWGINFVLLGVIDRPSFLTLLLKKWRILQIRRFNYIWFGQYFGTLILWNKPIRSIKLIVQKLFQWKSKLNIFWLLLIFTWCSILHCVSCAAQSSGMMPGLWKTILITAMYNEQNLVLVFEHQNFWTADKTLKLDSWWKWF